MKMIYVSGDDYASLEFSNAHKDEQVSNFIETFFSEGETSIEYVFLGDNHDEVTVSIDCYDFGEIDPKFNSFVRNNVQDYDDSKHSNFYFEADTL